MLRYPLLVTLVLALVGTARGADDPGAIAPLVNDSTLGMVRLDLQRLDLKDWEHPSFPIEQVRKRLLDAGAKEAFLLATPTTIQRMPGIVVVPLNGADEQKVTAALAEPFAPKPKAKERPNPDQYVAQRVRDAVVLGPLGEVRALAAATASTRADLAETIKSAGDAPIAGAFALAPSAAAMLEQTLPNLPPQMGGHRVADLTRAFRSASVWGDPAKGLTLKVQTADGASAGKLLPLVQTMVKQMMTNTIAASKEIPPAQVKADGAVIVAQLSPEQFKASYDASLASALWVQSARHLRHIGLAIVMYYNDKKTWPADFDAMIKSRHLDPALLTNPRNPTANPGYVYVKPVGKWEKIDSQNINLYENVGNDFSSGIVVGFMDGHAEVLSAKEKDRFEQQLKKTEADNAKAAQ